MKKLEDICVAYLEGYFYAKITEHFIIDKIQSSDLDALNKLAVESMKDYILESLDETVIKLEELKKEGKDKTATYRQLTARKLNLQNVISFYKMFDLIKI